MDGKRLSIYSMDCYRMLISTGKYTYFRERGLYWATIRTARLGYDPNLDAYTIPYYTASGEIRTMRYRAASDDAERKYWWMGEGGAHLYNLHRALARSSAMVWLTEGEIDCLILDQLGFPAVGVPGAAVWRKQWSWLLEGMDVTIVYDADPAGIEGAQRTASMLSTAQPQRVRIARLPDGYDVNQLAMEDVDELLRRIS